MWELWIFRRWHCVSCVTHDFFPTDTEASQSQICLFRCACVRVCARACVCVWKCAPPCHMFQNFSIEWISTIFPLCRFHHQILYWCRFLRVAVDNGTVARKPRTYIFREGRWKMGFHRIKAFSYVRWKYLFYKIWINIDHNPCLYNNVRSVKRRLRFGRQHHTDTYFRTLSMRNDAQHCRRIFGGEFRRRHNRIWNW